MKGYYINLDCRVDRRRHIENNILTIDFFKGLDRLPAIFEPRDGVGCLKSWIVAIEKCLEYTDEDRYLIIEDDLSIDNDINFKEFIKNYETIKDNDEWGVLTFTPHWSNKNLTDLSSVFPDKIGNFHKIWNCFTCTGLIIKRNVINVLLNNLKECLCMYNKHGTTGLNNDIYKIDIYWFKIQKHIKLICYQDGFCSQLDGISNNICSNNINESIPIFSRWDDLGRRITNKIKTLLLRYINDPYNDYNCFYLAYEYENNKQFALALSYYLKCADFTKYKELEYESMIRIALCLGGMGHRCSKELSALETAVSILPNRPEAYNLLSLYHSYRSLWKKGYMYAILGLQNIDTNNYELYFDCSYSGKGLLLFQQAYCGHHIGKVLESIMIYQDIIYDDTIDKSIKTLSQNNLNDINSQTGITRNYTVYSNDNHDILRYKFNYSENIVKNYSEIYQDIFVLTMHNGKDKGTYLEIGSNDPFLGNNTYLLEKQYNWSGISIDIDVKCVRNFKSYRKNKCLCEDALKIDYYKLLEKYETIDYLQLDCDPPNITYDILLKIPFDKVKFGVITYEHDYYIDLTKTYRDKSRKYLCSMGYKLIVGNISPNKDNNPFEDWWIHPDLIDKEIYDLFTDTTKEYIFGEDHMLNKVLDDKTISENSGLNYAFSSINKYHKNDTAYFYLHDKCFISDCIRRGYRWEEHQHDLIDKYLNKNSVVIEAGSHIGTISVKFSKVCKHVYCFEPLIYSYKLLEKNMKLNSCRNYTAINKALGERNKKERIQWISKESMCATGLTGNMYSTNKDEYIDDIIDVDVITIDSLKLEQLDYIKIDVEGYEENVIDGGFNTIKKFKPIIILECYKSFNPLVEGDIEFVKNKYTKLLNIGYTVEHVWKADFLFTCQKQIVSQNDLNLVIFGNKLFTNQLKRLNLEASCTCWFNNIFIETPETIERLISENNNIFEYERGFGYWIWKPYIILNSLKKMKDGGILVYLDAGSSIIHNDKEKNKYIDILNTGNKSIITFSCNSYKEKQFQKHKVLKYFCLMDDNHFLNSYHIESGCVIVKKTERSIEFIEEWLHLCKYNNHELLDDTVDENESIDFIEHRHDQSLLSILSKKSDIVYILSDNDLYQDSSCFFPSRLTDNGPRKYAKSLPNLNI